MYNWMRKIHMYAGLLSFTAFVVWGVTGIHGALLPPPGEGGPPDVSNTRDVTFVAPGNMNDRELAQRVFEASGVTLARGGYNTRRDENQNLTFMVYTPNGRRDVTYFETEQRIHVEERRNALFGFFSSMHTGRYGNGPPELCGQLWGAYNEFSNWAFLFMTLSGLYLWLATRPRLRWAWATAMGAVVVFGVLWGLL